MTVGPDELKCRCGIASMAGGYEPGREQRAQGQRDADADDARRPAPPVEDLAQHGAARKAAQEIAREIEAACSTAIDRGGATDETGRCRLGEEGADSDQG